jgi:predicted SAM-dependent methyltransferase
MEKEVKLHLGCFNKKLHGFINIDCRPEVEPDIMDDVFKLEKFERGSVSLIYACHVVEHTDFVTARQAFKRYHELLREGGIFRIAVPDIMACAEELIYWEDMEKVKSAFWGSQRHWADYHKSGWTEESLTKDLYQVGFEEVRRWDCRTLEPHSYVDDYSHAYSIHRWEWDHNRQPAPNKLLSLNLEAIK